MNRNFFVLLVLTSVLILASGTTAHADDRYSVATGAWSSPGTWSDASGGTPGAGVPATGDNVFIEGGVTVTLDENSADLALLAIASGSTFYASGAFTVSATNITVNGLFNNGSAGVITASVININNGGTYNHSNAGTILPSANWNEGSTCMITGWTSGTLGSSFSQSFYNFTWDCPGQVGHVSLGGNVAVINGTFTVKNTGGGGIYPDGDPVYGEFVQTGGLYNLTYYTGTPRSVTVIRDFLISSGEFNQGWTAAGTLSIGGNYFNTGGVHRISVGATSPSTATVTGNFTMTSGIFIIAWLADIGTIIVNGDFSMSDGIIHMSRGSGVGELILSGDFSHTGGIIDREVPGGSGSIVFNGNEDQIYNSGGTLSGTINFSVNSGSVLKMASPSTVINGGGSFTLQDGAALAITSPYGITDGTTGNIQVEGPRTFSSSASYIYCGSSAQNTGNALPLTVADLSFENNAGAVTLNSARTITGSFSVTAGSHADPGGYISNAGTLVLGGIIQPAGSFGSTGSGADQIMDDYFTGTGYVVNGFNTGSWLGITESWNSGANWIGGVPVSGTDVDIRSSTSYQPVISALPAAVCNDLTINVGASLAVNSGQALTVNGDLTNSGTLEIFSGYNEGTLTSSGSLIVKSNSTGNVTYHRQLRPKSVDGDYHYFASPVSGNTVLNADKVTTVWRYNEVNGLWPTLAMTALESGRGYNLAQTAESDGLITFRGTLVTADIGIDATSPYGDVINGSEPDYDDRHYAGESVEYPIGHSEEERSLANYGGGGWNMLGNPYTSALLVSDFIAANTPPVTTVSQFDPNYVAVYLYDGNTAEHNVYYYIGNPTGWGAGTTQTHVQAGQGFFVLAMNDYSSFTFNRGMQEHSTGALMLKSAGKSDRWPGLQLKIKSGSNENLTTVVFNDEMTAGLDPGYDVGLMSSGPGAGIYTALVNDNGINFTRQALPLNGVTKMVIPVGVDYGSGGDVEFTAETEPLRQYRYMLEDRATGLFTDLGMSGYKATLPAKTYGTGRFFLHVTAGRIVRPRSGEANLTGIRIWYSNDSQINIQGEVGDGSYCEVYDTRGHKLYETRLEGGSFNSFAMPADARGVYVVKVTDGTNVTIGKIVVL